MSKLTPAKPGDVIKILEKLGFKRIRLIDFAWAAVFVLVSNLLLTLLSVLFAALYI